MSYTTYRIRHMLLLVEIIRKDSANGSAAFGSIAGVNRFLSDDSTGSEEDAQIAEVIARRPGDDGVAECREERASIEAG
jgi:hypothetical protein